MLKQWLRGSVLLMLLYATAGIAEDFQIAVIPKGTRHMFWQTVHAGAVQAGKDLGVSVSWRGPSEDDDHRAQIRFVERAIEAGVDGIVLAPNHQSLLLDVVRQATEQGIKVVIIDSGMEGDYYLSFVGSDNYQGGVLAAKRLAEVMGGEGNVMLMRYYQGNASTDQREQGFVDGLHEVAPAIRIIVDEYVGASLGEAYRNSVQLLARNPQIDGIFAPNESTTAGVMLALKVSYPGRLGKIKVVGFDINDNLLASLKAHQLHGLLVQQPFDIGYQGVKAMVAALREEQVAPRIVTDIVVLTPEKAQEFEQVEKALPDEKNKN